MTTPEDVLAKLGLDKLPTKEQIHRAMEEEHWEDPLVLSDLLTFERIPAPTELVFERAGLEGKIIGCKEPKVSISKSRPTATTSTSLQRAPNAKAHFVRGKTGNVPFKPGGLNEIFKEETGGEVIDLDSETLRTVPPGFSRGLKLEGDVDEEVIVFSDLPEDDLPAQPSALPTRVKAPTAESTGAPTGSAESVTIQRRRPPPQLAKREWAHIVNVDKPFNNFHELVPDMAHKYPFELDTFQKEAVYHLEMGDSVFVAAHTSAGKTVVAEYAISLSAKHMTRTIYTSPIKALSNQKYRDFKTTYGSANVGILTGDVQINPEANCLVMTTEILRSMLYKGADIIRDVEFVVFDEVHYVNDAERGVVWEEVIIMLPDHVNIILLSATVPNTKEFAEWVGRTKKKDIYVISTPKRPVPLEHYLYAGREMYKIVDAGGKWLGTGYKDAGEALRRKQDKEREAAGLAPIQRVGARGGRGAAAQQPQRGRGGGGGGGRGGPSQRGGGGPAPRGGGGSHMGSSGPRSHQQQDKNLWVHLVGHLKKKNLLPVVIFTFSKKRCEENAGTLSSTDLSDAKERSEIHLVWEKALGRLKGTDKKLPQIARMRDLLSRGIGVHHGGLLPLVKEVVEILFARGLVKVLFATETFAMGVNMPARSVVFSGIRKHDGKSFRDLLPGEYTQMSGRAGRRGLDETGVVIIVSGDELPDTGTLNRMILGVPNKLQSQFRLTYNMILNLLRVEALKVEEMIKRSFSENASQSQLPEQQKRVLQLEQELKKLPKLECETCLQDAHLYYDFSAEYVHLNKKILELAGTGKLVSGRVVVLRDTHFAGNLAIFLKNAGENKPGERLYYALALVDEQTKARSKAQEPASVPPRWLKHTEPIGGTYEFAEIPLSSVHMVTSKFVKIDLKAIVQDHRISVMQEAVGQLAPLASEWSTGPGIEEIEWLKGKGHSIDVQDALQDRAGVERALGRMVCVHCTEFDEHYALLHRQMTLHKEIGRITFELSDQNLELLPDYEQRIQVLKDLRLIDDNQTVLLKGRVACEAGLPINSVNELILTEVILDNMLAAYEPEEVVALLSCFLFQDKTEVTPQVPDKLKAGLDEITKLADRVGRRQLANKVADPDFAAKLKFGLVEVVYEWAKGMPFDQITDLTDVAEGTIVRVITRLDETCREVRDAARVIGDGDLFRKMEEAQVKIKRDSECRVNSMTTETDDLVVVCCARDVVLNTMSESLSLGSLGVRCPITVERLLVVAGNAVLSKGTMLFKWRRGGERGEVRMPYGGQVVSWGVEEGETIGDGGAAVARVEACKHPVEWGGMCASCGDEVGTYAVRLTHDAVGPTVSHEEAYRIEQETAERLTKARKLSLIVDLDQTVVHATVDPTVGEWMAQGEPNPNYTALRDVARFVLADGSSPDGCWYYIKPRPGLSQFLRNLSVKYEMHVYTMGTRAYATEVCKAIDPDGSLFAGRILSRDESGSMTQKNIERLFPVDQSMVVIIDDRADVWNTHQNNLVKVIPYDFFVGIGDINAGLLPKQQDALQLPPGATAPQPVPAPKAEAESAPEPAPTPESEQKTTTPPGSPRPTHATIPIPPPQPQPPLEEEPTSADNLPITDPTPTDPPTPGEGEGETTTDETDSTAEPPPPAAATDSLVPTPSLSSSTPTLEQVATSESARVKLEAKPSPNDDSVRESLIEAVREERPLAKRLEAMVAEDPVAGNQPDQVQANAPARAVLRDDDRELDRIALLLDEIHARFYEAYEKEWVNANPKSRRNGPRNFNVQIPLRKSEYWRQSELFGARCHARLEPEITHVVAAKRGTEKVNQARAQGTIAIVRPEWLHRVVTTWTRAPEEDYLLDPADRDDLIRRSREEEKTRTNTDPTAGPTEMALVVEEEESTPNPGLVGESGIGTPLEAEVREQVDNILHGFDYQAELDALMDSDTETDDGSVSSRGSTPVPGSSQPLKRQRSITPGIVTSGLDPNDPMTRSPLAKRKRLSEMRGSSRLGTEMEVNGVTANGEDDDDDDDDSSSSSSDSDIEDFLADGLFGEGEEEEEEETEG
ncbi:Antiviral helicase, partial [Rhizoctonia solani]